MTEDTDMVGFNYNSVMNVVANIPDYTMCFIQQQNIKTKITNTVHFTENLVKGVEEDEDEKEDNENIKIEKSI